MSVVIARLSGVGDQTINVTVPPPKDRFKMVYFTMLLFGIGTLLPWNMFINAYQYFIDLKLSKNYTKMETSYTFYFLPCLTFASQAPNLVMNWINVFVRIGGRLTPRILWSIAIEIVIFFITVILAFINSSRWPGVFFTVTLIKVVVLNAANGIFQNTVFGMAARLPSAYTGVIIIGQNISGLLASVLSIISIALAPDAHLAAMCYFACALIVLIACFIFYFLFLHNKFYKHYETLKGSTSICYNEKIRIPPYCEIFKKAFPQCFNVFLIFFITLALFPSVDSSVRRLSDTFFLSDKYYVGVMCFLNFNVFAMFGSGLFLIGPWPSPKRLWVPIVMRFVFIPLFLFCNYNAPGRTRSLPVVFNDWVYFLIGSLFALTSGYFSAVAMMYCSLSVDKEYSYVANMYGAAWLMTGINAGIAVSFIFPLLV